MAVILPERLVQLPGVKTINPADALARIERYVSQCPRMEGIIIIGREGDLSTFNCRPTRNLPQSRVRDVMIASLRNDQKAQKDDPFETLIQIPGMRQLSLRETEKRVQQFIATCLGMTLVLLLCKDGGIDNLRCLRSANLSNGAAREVLRNALAAFDKRGLPPPLA